MLIRAGEFHLFREQPMEGVYRQRQENVLRSVRNRDAALLSALTDEAVVDEIMQEQAIKIPFLDIDAFALRHQFEDYQSGPERVGRRAITIMEFGVPFEGEESGLRMDPGSGTMWTAKAMVNDGDVTFVIEHAGQSESQIAADLKRLKEGLAQKYRQVLDRAEGYNQQLRKDALTEIGLRRKRLAESKQLVENLKIPVKPRGNQEIIKIPGERRTIAPRPVAAAALGALKPDPVLDDKDYAVLLETIHLFGKGMERHPSTHIGKDEEAIRDHLLILMDALFKPSTTAETFNKGGKTDILLAHEKSNLFVAECLVWKGPEYFVGKQVNPILLAGCTKLLR